MANDDYHDDSRAELQLGSGQLERPRKRQRSHVAKQACERCRVKKTRCDEQFPCGICQNTGVDCVYRNQKSSRAGVSSDTFMRILEGFESRLDHISARVPKNHVPSPHELHDDISEPQLQEIIVTPETNVFSSPQCSSGIVGSLSGSSHPTVIPFSAHQMISWRGVIEVLPDAVQTILAEHGMEYATILEKKRSRLVGIGRDRPRSGHKEPDTVSKLSISIINELCDAYFATFQLAHPILDRSFFFHQTIPKAIHGNFGHDVESCVVLVMMALGCWGKRALSEVSLGHHSENHQYTSDQIDTALDGKVPGLQFFKESQYRSGCLLDDNSIQSCQYYLLAGLFHAQTVRPVDWWTMNAKAATCCRMFWENPPSPCNSWLADMQSRLFWNAVMFEAILTQELNLPSTELHTLSEQVPLPKFVKLEQHSFIAMDTTMEEEDDESFFHYHFLAQIAHRLLLTRTRNSLFHSTPDGQYPSASIEEELSHQLQSWRNQLPPGLKFNENIPFNVSESPKDILVVPWLRVRYVIAKYHIGRPILHKVLSYPNRVTDDDLQRCRKIFNHIFDLEPILATIGMMKNCMPLKFSISAQLFGQILVVYCFRHHSNFRIMGALPPEYQSWSCFALKFLQESAPYSPALATDAEIAFILCQNLN